MPFGQYNPSAAGSQQFGMANLGSVGQHSGLGGLGYLGFAYGRFGNQSSGCDIKRDFVEYMRSCDREIELDRLNDESDDPNS